MNRPWILYEAGVAKGKLNTSVHGVALGVPLSQVSTGPFYQFQNCQDDEEGLTGLVMQLVRRIPNAEPAPEAIKAQVATFKTNANQILEDTSPDSEDEAGETGIAETSAAKLFEEIKVMFRDLPSTLEDRLTEGNAPIRSRRFKHFHPMMMKDIMHVLGSKTQNPNLGILIIVSLLRDEIPWLYELGIELYRAGKTKRKEDVQDALTIFRSSFGILLHHPAGEVWIQSKETFMLIQELDKMTENISHLPKLFVDKMIDDEIDESEFL